MNWYVPGFDLLLKFVSKNVSDWQKFSYIWVHILRLVAARAAAAVAGSAICRLHSTDKLRRLRSLGGA